VVRLERQPGQKESRYAHLLGGPVAAEAWDVDVPAAAAAGTATGAGPGGGSGDRFAALEARIAAVEAELAELRRELGHEVRAFDRSSGGQTHEPSGP
jgi:uncharacterized protein YceH (UPF0502 family)